MAGHLEPAIHLVTYAELDTFVRTFAGSMFNLLCFVDVELGSEADEAKNQVK